MQSIVLITRAMEFAAHKHTDIRRKGVRSEPYVNHLAEVARLLADATSGEDAALVVEIDASVRRPDGSIYHITWSFDRAAGRKPVESNAVLLAGWRGVEPIQIALIPRFFG